MRRWYRVAVGGLGWTPGTFWRSTMGELFLAIEGHNEANRPPGPGPMTRAEFEELEEQYLHADRR